MSKITVDEALTYARRVGEYEDLSRLETRIVVLAREVERLRALVPVAKRRAET